MKVLIACASFSPNYGGPAFSVSRLARAMAEAGHEIGLWAPDGSAVSSPVVSVTDGLMSLSGSVRDAVVRFRTPDVLHDNGIWLPHNHALAALAKRDRVPRVVSPRGALEPWAMAHKALKKKIAWALYQKRDLLCTDRLHATAESEASNIRRHLPSASVTVIPNGIDAPSLEPAPCRPVASPRVALFVGRIYPVKGLPMLVDAWAKVRPQGWVLRIAGPDEGGHRSEVEQRIRERGLCDAVVFLGPLAGEDKARAYAEADLFILPTLSENFGIVVGEALAAGVPVLSTRGAPWPSLIQEGCGWWVEISVEGLATGLRAAVALDSERLRAMGIRGRRFVKSTLGWSAVATWMAELYAKVQEGAV
jgi:glycosyltransferase involved in cell wall biosynthesis